MEERIKDTEMGQIDLLEVANVIWQKICYNVLCNRSGSFWWVYEDDGYTTVYSNFYDIYIRPDYKYLFDS